MLPQEILAIQWLGLCTFTAVAPGSIPGQGTKITQAVQHSQKKKEKKKVATNERTQPTKQGKIS